MIEDTSSEFDMFEDVRRKLTEIFQREGRELIEAERLALYVVQGVRDVPKFLATLADTSAEDHKQVMPLLYDVLNDAAALERALRILLGLEPAATD